MKNWKKCYNVLSHHRYRLTDSERKLKNVSPPKENQTLNATLYRFVNTRNVKLNLQHIMSINFVSLVWISYYNCIRLFFALFPHLAEVNKQDIHGRVMALTVEWASSAVCCSFDPCLVLAAPLLNQAIL